MFKCLKQIVLSSKRRGCRMQNDGQNVWVTRCLKVGWLHERTSKVTQDPRFQDQDACRPWIMGVGWAGTTSGLLTWLCRTGENILLVYRGTSHGSGAGVKQNCCLWKFLFRKHLFFFFWHIVPTSRREIVWTPQVFVQLKVTLVSFIVYFTVQAWQAGLGPLNSLFIMWFTHRKEQGCIP